MDESRFDRFTREFGTQVSRRSFVARILGLGAAVVAGGHTIQHAGAARRGFSGPRLPRIEPRCQLPSDCPPCKCVGPQTIECGFCNVDQGFCGTIRSSCSGCCETVDDVGVCACDDV